MGFAENQNTDKFNRQYMVCYNQQGKRKEVRDSEFIKLAQMAKELNKEKNVLGEDISFIDLFGYVNDEQIRKLYQITKYAPIVGGI